MSVVLFIPHLGKGGAEEVILNHSNSLQSRGVKINLFLLFNLFESRYNKSRLDKSIEVRYLFPWEISFKSYQRRLLTLLLYAFSPAVAAYLFFFKFKDFNNLHCNLTLPTFYVPFFKLLSILKKKSPNIIVTFHSNYHLLNPFTLKVNSLGWASADKVVYELFYKDRNNLLNFVKEADLFYIPFGYNKLSNSPVDDHSEGVKALENFKRRHKDSKLLMTVSRIRFFEKKIDVMINTFKCLRDLDDSWIFAICGDGEDMALAKKMCHNLGLSDYVLFTGYVDNTEYLSSLSDAYVVATVESFTGVSGMQAIAQGCNVFGVQTLAEESNRNFDNLITNSCPVYLAEDINACFDNQRIQSKYKDTLNKINTQNKFNSSTFTNKYINRMYK